MKVYVVRHTDAEPAANYAADAERPLTDKGRKQAKSVGLALGRIGAAPGVVLASPFLRARQTAEILTKAAGWDAPIEDSDSLLPGVSAGRTIKALASRDCAEVAVVGHAPQVEELLSAMLAGKAKIVRRDEKGLRCLRRVRRHARRREGRACLARHH
jgi:phosphohistidine phosphatase